MGTLIHERLNDTAKSGDIDDLYLVLEQDSRILEVIDQNPFIDTPLHVAVTYGQACFVEEITNLKPSFVRKLNQRGYSPLHLAAANGQVEIVKQLLMVDSSLGELQGREKKTPLHCAAMAGSIEALDELIFNCHNSLSKLTIRKETALHLALKHGQLETFEALFRWIEERNMESLLSCTDHEGNTVLHLATSLRQHQIVKTLCSSYMVRRAAKVNARNNSGLTALDLDELLKQPNETLELQKISKILHNAGAKRACDLKLIKPTPTKQPRLAIHRRQTIMHYFDFRVHEDIPSDVRNTLLVILVLIATVTFQVGTNPPGGNWPDDSANGKHGAGDPIWLEKDRTGYCIFTIVNYAGFIISSVLIFRLVEGYPYRGPIQVAQSLLVFTYAWSTPLLPYSNKVNFVLLTVSFPVGMVAILWINRKPRQFS